MIVIRKLKNWHFEQNMIHLNHFIPKVICRPPLPQCFSVQRKNCRGNSSLKEMLRNLFNTFSAMLVIMTKEWTLCFMPCITPSIMRITLLLIMHYRQGVYGWMYCNDTFSISLCINPWLRYANIWTHVWEYIRCK